jgi:hypothetical protein
MSMNSHYHRKIGEIGQIVNIMDDDPNVKSYMFAYSLLILGGTQGLHHFYLHNWFLGSLYAMTKALGGMALVGDFFLLPFHVFLYNFNRRRRRK